MNHETWSLQTEKDFNLQEIVTIVFHRRAFLRWEQCDWLWAAGAGTADWNQWIFQMECFIYHGKQIQQFPDWSSSNIWLVVSPGSSRSQAWNGISYRPFLSVQNTKKGNITTNFWENLQRKIDFIKADFGPEKFPLTQMKFVFGEC